VPNQEREMDLADEQTTLTTVRCTHRLGLGTDTASTIVHQFPKTNGTELPKLWARLTSHELPLAPPLLPPLPLLLMLLLLPLGSLQRPSSCQQHGTTHDILRELVSCAAACSTCWSSAVRLKGCT
jgi:hypothetical protein